MGRKSVSSTKAGKFINPTDQARKEARRKELKKNKKQRLQVRQTVIKQKDPRQIFNEMEAIDKIEYDPNNPPPYNVKVLQEKRRKLKESWLKMFQFYQREDPRQAGELKGMEVEYERRRHLLETVYESVIQAQKVKLDDIPLPSMTMPPPPPPPDVSQPKISEIPAPKSILKTKTLQNIIKEPPGPPTTSPPTLSEFELDTDEFELGLTAEDAYKSQEKPKKIRFDSEEIKPKVAAPVLASQIAPFNILRPVIQPPAPPPPPPQQQYVTAQQISQSIQQLTTSRIVQQQQQQAQYYQQQPQRIAEPVAPQQTTTAATIFQAKPVLRNKMAEITRFVPTALVVKRTDTKKQPVSIQQQSIQQSSSSQGPFNYMLQQQQQYAAINPLTTYKSSLSSNSNYSSALIPSSVQQQAKVNMTPIISSNQPTAKRIEPTDDSYDTFMKEIGKLL